MSNAAQAKILPLTVHLASGYALSQTATKLQITNNR
jgi:hypothetical protein